MIIEKEERIIYDIIKHLVREEEKAKDILKEGHDCYIAIKDKKHKELKDKVIMVCIKIQPDEVNE